MGSACQRRLRRQVLLGIKAVGLAAALALGACNNAGTIISAFSVDADDTTGGQSAQDTYAQGPHTTLLQVTQSGGNVMTTPVLQAFSFNSDANAELYETFIATLPHTTYWSSTTAEYGVGAASATQPVRATLTPSAGAGLTGGVLARGESSDIEAFLTAQLDATTMPLGAPSPDTLYILFMPSGVAVSLDQNTPSTTCADGVLSWHTAMVLPRTKVTISYVVVPDCGAQNGLSPVDSRTAAASHAIIEAVTDPHMDAYAAFDANHIAWQVPAGGVEVGAACVAALYGDPNLIVTPTDLGFAVQRTWSNVQAALGHAPCVPAPSSSDEPYFDSVPVLSGSVQLPLGVNLLDPNLTMAGVNLPATLSTTVPVQLYDDAATSGPWSIAVTEVGTSQLTLSLSSAQGNNGDSLVLTMLANSQATGQSVVRLTSTLGVHKHSQYIIVAH